MKEYSHVHVCINYFRGETQNNFVYGELGRTSLESRHAVNVNILR